MICRNIILGFAALYLVLSQSVWSQPLVQEVQGEFVNGSTVTVTGMRFGSETTPAPLLWDSFENGTVGTSIDNRNAVIGDWDSDALPGSPVYSNAITHSGTKSSYHRFKDGTQNLSLSKNMVFRRLYMDFWVYADYAGLKSRNWKVWRFYGDGDLLQLNWVWYCNSMAVTTYDGCGPQINLNHWDGPDYSDRRWYHIQQEYQESGVNLANGSIHHFINGALAGVNSSSVKTRTCDHSFSEIRIGHYWALDGVSGCPANSGADVYVDDVYLDTGWSRVEIGDQPTYSASAHREIQIPSAWSDQSISIKVNRGSFSMGQAVYVYVLDANGAANAAGYPVILDDGTAVHAVSPKFSSSEPGTLTFYDPRGRLIRKAHVEFGPTGGGLGTVEQGLPEGVYICRFVGKCGQTIFKRLILK